MNYRFYAQNIPLMKKTLTDDRTKNILFVLSNSNVPLTSQQIIRQIGDKSKYTFERLKHLHPEEFDFSYSNRLFHLENFIENMNNKYKIKPTIEKITQHFKLDWLIDDDEIFSNYYCSIDDPFKNQTIIEIYNENKEQLILIRWQISDNDYTLGQISCHSKRTLDKFKPVNIKLKCDSDGHITFYLQNKNKNYKVKFLDVVLKDKIKIDAPIIKRLYEKYRTEVNNLSIVTKMVAELMHHDEYYFYPRYEIKKNIEIIFYDSKNWKYEINLKGFFLYLYIQANKIILKEKKIENSRKGQTSKSKENINENSRMDIRNIKNEVKRLLSKEIILRKCQFLKYNEDFMKEGFKTVDVLLNLAYEIVPQLDYYEDMRVFSEINVELIGEDIAKPIEHNIWAVTSQSIVVSPPKEERYFQWNLCKRYSYEIERYFQKSNMDNYGMIGLYIRSMKYPNVYKKLLEYRLYMANLLKDLIIFEKENLIKSYSIWYPSYMKLGHKDHIHKQQNYPNPDEFKKLIM